MDHPDDAEVPRLQQCRRCGDSLAHQAVVGYARRQVFDVPPPQLRVKEYQGKIKHCQCCDAAVNAPVSQPVQYGAGLKAMVVYLSQYQLLAYQRPRERILTPCAAQLHPFEQASKARLHDSPAAHFDETGMRLSQDLHWLHACSTEQLTCYHFDTRRGTHAMQAMGVPPWFKGTAVHDHRKPYYRYDANHALCNAHHLRELIHAREQHGQRWAQPMIACLLEAKAEVAAAIGRGREALTKPRLDYYQRRYSRILRNGRDELPHTHPPPGQRRGRRKQHPAKHPHDRLTRHKYEVLAYRYDFSVPFDNN